MPVRGESPCSARGILCYLELMTKAQRTIWIATMIVSCTIALVSISAGVAARVTVSSACGPCEARAKKKPAMCGRYVCTVEGWRKR